MWIRVINRNLMAIRTRSSIIRRYGTADPIHHRDDDYADGNLAKERITETNHEERRRSIEILFSTRVRNWSLLPTLRHVALHPGRMHQHWKNQEIAHRQQGDVGTCVDGVFIRKLNFLGWFADPCALESYELSFRASTIRCWENVGPLDRAWLFPPERRPRIRALPLELDLVKCAITFLITGLFVFIFFHSLFPSFLSCRDTLDRLFVD